MHDCTVQANKIFPTNWKMSIVLAEDKQYYKDATVLYEGAETIFQEEDTQPIEVPIIAPKRVLNFDLAEEEPTLNFSYDYLKESMKEPSHIRSLALFGPLHSGKTSFTDIFVKFVRDTRSQKERDAQKLMAKNELRKSGNQGTDSPWDNFGMSKPSELLERYTDTRLDERERGISTKSVGLSYMLPDSRGKSHLISVIDTPGHVNFRDDADVAARITDGAVLVVDAIMGTSECLKQQLRYLITSGGFSPSSVILVISHMDRLVLELRLPPTDAYFKLRHIIDNLNVVIAETLGIKTRTFKPEQGNVLFASGKFKFVFSLESFARSMYIHPSSDSSIFVDGFRPSSLCEEGEEFAEKLWGDLYYDRETGSVSRHPSYGTKRTFVEFVLEPLYKIIGACVGSEKLELCDFLAEIGVYLPSSILDSNVPIVLEAVMDCLLGGVSAFVDSVSRYVPNCRNGNSRIVERFYAGALSSSVSRAMLRADPEGPLVVHAVKSMHVADCNDFRVLARVMSGTLSRGAPVRVLGEAYSARNGETEDVVVTSGGRIFVPGGRYLVETESVTPGNIVVIEGLVGVRKTCTITSINATEEEDEEMEIFRPIAFSTPCATVKVSCEPLQPSDLPRLVDALRRLDRAYPQLQTKVEETGEHVIIGTGEVYLDSALHDLRKLYGGDRLLEIKLSDPVVVFSETCAESSQFQCSAASPNKLNALSFIAEPLTEIEVQTLTGVSGEMARGFADKERFFLSKEFRKERIALLTDRSGWDALAARSLWAFGPDWTSPSASSMLLNDTLPEHVSKRDLLEIREPIVQGFQWATREGPLIEETVRNCKFKLLDAVLHGSDEISRGSGQIIPTACRAIHASILTASPRLMEPVYLVEIEVPSDMTDAVLKVLSKRRGHVVKDSPKPGTSLTSIIAHVPVVDSFGLETDIRLFTRGMGFGVSWFDHWAVVPGDPLDSQVGSLPPLQPAPHMYLARDFLLKTRRRKGLSEEIVVQKYIDDVVSLGLARQVEGARQEDEEYW